MAVVVRFNFILLEILFMMKALKQFLCPCMLRDRENLLRE